MDCRSQSRRLNSEHGVFLALTAVGMFTILIFLQMTVDSMRAREARAFAQQKAEELCYVAVGDLPNARAAVERISSQLQQPIVHNGYSRLTGVSISIPTSPLDVDDDTPFVSGGPRSFAAMGVLGGCDSSIDCEFFGDVEDPTLAAKVPSNFWQRADFNAYVSCETEVTYDALVNIADLGLSRKVRGKTAVRSEVRGARPQSRGGVLVGIAPYVETYPVEQRFRFPLAQFIPNNALAITDHNQPPALGNLVFSDPRQVLSDGIHPDAFAFTDAIPSDRKYSLEWITRDPPLFLPQWAPWDSTESVIPFNYSARDELINQKHNLMTVARNHIIAGIAAVLSRHADTFDSGYVLLGPKNSDGSETPPVFLSVPGQNSTRERFRFPSLSWQHTSDLLIQLGAPNGYLCPYASCPNGSQHLVTSNVLADAFFATNRGNGARALTHDWLQNPNFESDRYIPRPQVAPEYPTILGNDSDYWSPSLRRHLMSIPELLQFTGSVEECPVQFAKAGTHCLKPGVELDPMRKANGSVPSIISFLKLANGSEPALRADRVHLPAPDGSPAPRFDNFDQDSMVLLFIQKPLEPSAEPAPADSTAPCSSAPDTPSSEMTAIRAEVDTLLSAQGRNIYVVYMPVNAAGLYRKQVCDLEYAFNAVAVGDQRETATGNRVFRIGPAGPDGNSACGSYLPLPFTPEDICMQQFFVELLGDGPRGGENIVKNLASLIFKPVLAL